MTSMRSHINKSTLAATYRSLERERTRLQLLGLEEGVDALSRAERDRIDHITDVLDSLRAISETLQ